MDILTLIISWLLMLGGIVFLASGTVGLIRMPDLYTRLHAASLTDTGGTLLIGAALMLQALFVFDNNMAAIKLSLIMFFTLFTSPTSSHALAKTALLSGQVPVDADGKPLLESSEKASQLARSRASDYKHGQDAERIDQQMQALGSSKGGKN